ncbi:MAG: Type I restriction modification DNA specificity protein [Clostridium butyricum DORA_1]|nr:MAG: Type I restriction modification DNA specificity protein [Clostridium butyricum DORA_1]
MNKNKEKVPKIRFPGFTEPWEQRKLGDMCDEFKSGSSILAKDICEQGEYPVYGGNGLRGYTATYNHDGIYALIGRQGALCGNMNKVYGKAYFTEHAVAVKANKNNNTDFLFFLLDKMNLRQYSGQSAQPGLAVNKLIELITLVPNCSEQKLIGIFFNKLDNLITLHQRKLNHLKDKKKGLLQKMFPKNGELIPELRFPEFTAPWEQRKLGELSNSFEYGLNAAATEFDGKNKYIRITDINDESRDFMDDDLTSPDIDLSNADKYKLSRGDILFARTGASVGKTYIYKECDGLVYYAGFLIRAKIREEYNPGFIFQNTLTKDYEKYISITSQRSGQPGVNAQEYSEYKIMVPNRAEQDKISAYFRSIDNLITLHQRKLDHLKEQKKALLQQMFI